MASSIPSPDEALAGMAKQGRTPIGREGAKFSSPSASPKAGTLVPKKDSKAGDPTGAGSKMNRQNVPQVPGGERHGAAYSIKAKYTKLTDPAAGMTQANGRIIASATKRDRANFDSGAGASY